MSKVVRADHVNAGDGFYMTADDIGEPLARARMPGFAAVLTGEGFFGIGSEKHFVVAGVLWTDAAAKIEPDSCLRDERKVHIPEFVAFAVFHDDLRIFPVEVVRRERQKFTVPDLGREQENDDGVVPFPKLRTPEALRRVVPPEENDLIVGEELFIGTPLLFFDVRNE